MTELEWRLQDEIAECGGASIEAHLKLLNGLLSIATIPMS